MHSGAIGETTRELLNLASTELKRLWRLYANGGHEGDWGYARVSAEVVDINTKMSIQGHVMRKVIDGRWVYRQMTVEERDDFDSGRAW